MSADPGAAAPSGTFRYSLQRLDGSLARLEVEVDAARLDAAVERVFQRRNQQAKIPGFRPGKAPRAIYERHYGAQHLWSEGGEDVIDETYREIVQNERLEPLERPRLEIQQLEPGKTLRYVANMTVRPEVKLGDYAAHGARVEPKAPADEDVERVIEGMREQHAELRPVERPAANGDVITVDIDAEVPEGEGKRTLSLARNGHLELGREYAVPGLSEGLLGVRANDERTLDLTFPEDADEDLRGKTAKFTVRVSAVSEKVLPPLDDGFAKTVGVADLAALRKAVRDELAHAAFHEARDEAADKAVAHAVATSEVTVPEVLVQDELDHMIADLRQRAAERGLPWERFLLQARKTEGQLREEWRAAAERRARSLLVLDAIAEKESVGVTSAELAREVALMPAATEQDQRALRSPAVLSALARSMRNRKVVDKLIGLDSPDAEREVLRSLGSDLDPHMAAAERAAADADAAAPAPGEPTTPGGIVLPSRSSATPEGRAAIRALMEEKDTEKS